MEMNHIRMSAHPKTFRNFDAPVRSWEGNVRARLIAHRKLIGEFLDSSYTF